MQKLGNADMTAMLYKEFVQEWEMKEFGDKNELSHAFKFLASYCLKNNQLTEAYEYAQKCLGFEEVSFHLFTNCLKKNLFRQKKKRKDC